MTLEAGLRELIAGIVRDEVARALAELRAPAEYLSTADAAALAAVAEGTIRRWIREGRIAEHRAGRHVRVRRDDLEALLAGGARRPVDDSPEARARRDFG